MFFFNVFFLFRLIVDSNEHDLEAVPTVPYEVSFHDEKFLREASKLIGSSLSDLDICHHRVILKLRKSCHELNADQLGKLSVMLLNCQSHSEGRSMYECTESMVSSMKYVWSSLWLLLIFVFNCPMSLYQIDFSLSIELEGLYPWYGRKYMECLSPYHQPS